MMSFSSALPLSLKQVMFSRIDIILLSLTVSEENEAADKTPATCVELQHEVVRQEIDTRQTQNPPHMNETHASVMHEMCVYCHSSPCVLFGESLLSCLRAFGQPRMTNHMKWKGDYKSFYTILNRCGLWHDPIYIARKEALGCYMEDFGNSC